MDGFLIMPQACAASIGADESLQAPRPPSDCTVALPITLLYNRLPSQEAPGPIIPMAAWGAVLGSRQ
jgi:hypothetical protein